MCVYENNARWCKAIPCSINQIFKFSKNVSDISDKAFSRDDFKSKLQNSELLNIKLKKNQTNR